MDKAVRIGGCVLALILLTAAGGLAAPGGDGAQAWTLEHCIRTAFESHGDVLAATDSVDAARAQLRGASSSLWFPTLSARSTRSEGRTEANQAGTSVRRTGSTSDEQHLLTGSVSLWDGGTQRLAVRQARAGETSAQASLRRTRQSLAYEVTSAYVRLLVSRHSLDVSNRRLAQARSQRKLVEGKVAAGAAAEVDVYPIDVQIASARVNQVRDTSEVRVAGTVLRNVMGLESGAVPDLQELPEALAAPPPLAECLEQALKARPDVTTSVAGLDRSRAGLSLTKLRTLPQLTSNANYNRGLGGSSIVSQWSVNAAVSWSFFDRGDRADIDAGAAGLRASEAQHQQLLKDIQSEVEQAHLALAGALERVDAARASVVAARKNLEMAEAKYKQDLAITLEIVDAQIAFSNAELEEIGARYDYFLARAQLDRAMGKDFGEE